MVLIRDFKHWIGSVWTKRAPIGVATHIGRASTWATSTAIRLSDALRGSRLAVAPSVLNFPRMTGLRLPFRASIQRYVAIACVLLLHIVSIWIVAATLQHVTPEGERETQITVFGPTAQASRELAVHPTFLVPQALLVPEPDISIEPDHVQSTLSSVSTAQMLAPRPDPAHVNPPVRVSTEFGNSVIGSPILRILIQPDGSVSDASIVQTTGNSALDALAIAWVKQNWRFIAASVSGVPVSYWTTVNVPFKLL